MKKTYSVPSVASVAVLLCFAACGGGNEAKERVRAEREAWEASLPDSLRLAEAQQDSLKSEIDRLGKEVDALLPQFKYIDNPREVEGYYMADAWTGAYPLAKTGLVARITKGEQLELIAALSGGAHFDRIRVQTPDATAESSTVPYDQALNYRMSGLNTVCFSDSAASECARVIATAGTQPVKITYLNGDRPSGQFPYPARDVSLMTLTWNLFDARSQMTHDERMIPLLAKKAAIIQQRIERTNQK